MPTPNEPLALNNSSSSIETLMLPEPGQSLNHATHELKMTKIQFTKDLKVKQIKELLKAYGLPISGKHDVLLEHVRNHASDPEQWNAQFMPARGVEQGSILQHCATNSHAACRIIAKFGEREQPTEFLPRCTAGEFGVQIYPLNESKKAAGNAWAQKVLAWRADGAPSQEKAAIETAASEPAAEDPDCEHSQDLPGGVQCATVSDMMGRASGNSSVIGQVRVSGMMPALDKFQGITTFRRLERHVVDLNRGVMSKLGELKAQLNLVHHVVSAMGEMSRLLSSSDHSSSSSHPLPGLLIANPGTSSSVSALAPTRRKPTWNMALSRSPFTSTSNAPSTPMNGQAFFPEQTLPMHTTRTGTSPLESARGFSKSSSEVHPTLALQVTPSAGTSSTQNLNLMYFELSGKRVAFDKTTVPNPHQGSFKDNLLELFREWHKLNLLTISGCGIPIKHWAWFYMKRMNIKPFAWTVIRTRWHNWKALIKERERFTSDDAIWAAYSDADGKHLNQQTILARIIINISKYAE